MWRFWYPRREDQNPVIGFILLMKGENQMMIQLFYLSDQIKIHRFTNSKRNSKLSSNHDSFFALGWLYTSPGNHHTTEPFTKHHCQASTKHPLPATLSLWLFRRGRVLEGRGLHIGYKITASLSRPPPPPQKKTTKQHNKRDNVIQQSFPAVTDSVQFEQEAFQKPYCSNDIFIFRWNWKSL